MSKTPDKKNFIDTLEEVRDKIRNQSDQERKEKFINDEEFDEVMKLLKDFDKIPPSRATKLEALNAEIATASDESSDLNSQAKRLEVLKDLVTHVQSLNNPFYLPSQVQKPELVFKPTSKASLDKDNKDKEQNH
jgi:archaellum component FlaC